MSNHSVEVTGGCGAGYHAKVIISEAGYYTLTSGTGGTSQWGISGLSGSGSATTIVKDGVTVLSVGAGDPGYAGSSTGPVGAGAGGTITINTLTPYEVYVNTSGATGTTAGKGGTAWAPAGPISGHDWGRPGNAYTGYSGGAVGGGFHGYLMLKYVGPLPDES